MDPPKSLHIGTCSWKYDSWRGIIYPERGEFNFLQEYSKHYNTVEIDQWFWSLFKGDVAVLPKPTVVEEYCSSVPENFLFSIKVPNSITLTHHYKSKPIRPNPHFLSPELMMRFLDTLAPIQDMIGVLMFQFEYLNKQKMNSQQVFTDMLEKFFKNLPRKFNYAIEIRNPNFLNDNYFNFLQLNSLQHVFLQGYYMPSIFDLFDKYYPYVTENTVIRLHGPDRQKIEEKTGKTWTEIVSPRDDDIKKLTKMVKALIAKDVRSFIYVNNHFEGSAPRTISKIKAQLLPQGE